MAFIKYGSAVITRPVLGLESWAQKKTASVTGKPSSYIDLADYPVDKFLFSQATIMGAVELEPNGFFIKKGYEQLVNMNGDCWTRGVVLNTHKTYRGSYNFLNHVQIPEQSKGTVMDSVPKWVTLPNGKKAIYVDILVATDRKHARLCQEIEDNTLNAMSLGAVVKFSICSKCGKTVQTGKDYCSHLRNERRGVFTDDKGVRRIIGEICGKEDDPSSNTFIESSWVYEPAFAGATKAGILSPSKYPDPSVTASVVKVGKPQQLEYVEPTFSSIWF